MYIIFLGNVRSGEQLELFHAIREFNFSDQVTYTAEVPVRYVKEQPRARR